MRPTRETASSSTAVEDRPTPSHSDSAHDDVLILDIVPAGTSTSRKKRRQVPEHWNDFPWIIDQMVEECVSRSVLKPDQKTGLEHAARDMFDGLTMKEAAAKHKVNESTTKKYFNMARGRLYDYLGDDEPPAAVQELLQEKEQEVTLADIHAALQPNAAVNGTVKRKIKAEPLDEYNEQDAAPVSAPSTTRRAVKREIVGDDDDHASAPAKQARHNPGPMVNGYGNGHEPEDNPTDGGIVRDNTELLRRLYNGHKIIVFGTSENLRARVADVLQLEFSGGNIENLAAAVVYTFCEGPLLTAANLFHISHRLIIDALQHCEKFVAFDLCRVTP